MRKIYILHQYLDENHFKALYECGKNYGYEIEDYFVADKFYIFKNMIKKEIFHKKLGLTWKEGFAYLRKQTRLKKIKNELFVVGFAPYDSLLFKYRDVIKNNISVYFSSWQIWDGSSFPRGKIKNKKMWEQIMKLDFNGAACVSRMTQKGVSQYIRDSIVVNHALPIDEYVTKTDYKQNKSFLFFGRFEDAKNMKFIVKWLEKNPNIECSIDFAGFGSYQAQIEEISQNDSRVHYLGLLDKNELKKIIHKYDFTLLPSRFEPFGITLLESLAAGTPCLTSNASGPAEIIYDKVNGIVCDKDLYESFDNSMLTAINLSATDYRVLCENAEKSGKNYSSDVLAKKWCDLFDKLLG